MNDLIAREKAQRLELQRLWQQRDVEVASMVQTGTSQMKNELDQLKSILQTTSGQMMQALIGREHIKNQKEQLAPVLEETRHTANQESCLTKRLRAMEEALNMASSIMVTLSLLRVIVDATTDTSVLIRGLNSYLKTQALGIKEPDFNLIYMSG